MSVTPEVVSKKVCREIVAKLVEVYRQSHLGNRIPAYDGKKSLYTAGALPFTSKEFVIELPTESAGSSQRFILLDFLILFYVIPCSSVDITMWVLYEFQ